MKYRTNVIRTLGVALVSASATSAGLAAEAGGQGSALMPHRAVYDMSLLRAGPSAGITTLTGRMVFEISGNACDGYKQRMRFVTRTMNRRGKFTLTDQRSTFVETDKSFTFETKQFRNKRLAETIKGSARRPRGGKGARVTLTRPSNFKLAIDSEVVFPVEHSRRLLEAARSGQNLYSTDLYDGSEKGKKVYATTAAVGRFKPNGVNEALERAEGDNVLDELGAWPIALSYFETGDKRKDGLPAYELSFLYFENGVSRKLLIDYGNFSMRGRLKALKVLPSKPCSK